MNNPSYLERSSQDHIKSRSCWSPRSMSDSPSPRCLLMPRPGNVCLCVFPAPTPGSGGHTHGDGLAVHRRGGFGVCGFRGPGGGRRRAGGFQVLFCLQCPVLAIVPLVHNTTMHHHCTVHSTVCNLYSSCGSQYVLYVGKWATLKGKPWGTRSLLI